ncbi:unnamed protein product, partial [Staurois parvus]
RGISTTQTSIPLSIPYTEPQHFPLLTLLLLKRSLKFSQKPVLPRAPWILSPLNYYGHPVLLSYVPSLTSSISPSHGAFPSPLKHAHITPILKKPSLNPTNLSNLRPISLHPFTSKLLERLVYNRLSS